MSTQKTAQVLKMLGNAHCLCIMLRLLGEGKTLENLSEATGLSPATVTYYVNRLRQRNLVKGERQGHQVSYSANAENTDALALLQSVAALYCEQAASAS
ncbi:MAG: winged helix-turn-helix transcriptional regulator [Acidiferrobacteraceae bacterium]|nr:winged helix-turn-helix transcriptional regulator [Acidiferrobacteraceae bacterium]MBT4396176.1 winged helix-turn-helix transcriptional regulator [Acidiferrobacteraceae bacterium]MBT4806829.1 winged helix-turn-helix transcriptional regulator [Acidiferrobacteraceae bacterium]MBT5980577.1 winged helix-turn-helix transcriptional regulator [Acidiferrobacteraceae bacterium]